MTASFPTSIKSFTTKYDGAGNYIFARSDNDLQDEVVALETFLGINGANVAQMGLANTFTTLQTINPIANGDFLRFTGTETRVDAHTHMGYSGYYTISPTGIPSRSYVGEDFSIDTSPNTFQLPGISCRNDQVYAMGTGIIGLVTGYQSSIITTAPTTTIKGMDSSVSNYGTNTGFVYGLQTNIESKWWPAQNLFGVSPLVKVARIRLMNQTVGNTGGAVMGDAMVVYASAQNDNAAGTAPSSITRLAGFQYDLTNGAYATITNSYGYYLSSPSNAGTITNHYGIYLADQTVAGSTLNYALYIAGGAVYFGGTKIGFFAHAVATQPTVSGSRAGNNALASLLTALAGLGLVIDSSS